MIQGIEHSRKNPTIVANYYCVKESGVSHARITKVSRVSRFKRIRQAAMTEKGTDLTDSGIYCYLMTFMHIYILININNPSIESHGERQNITYSLLNYAKEDERFACESFYTLCYLHRVSLKMNLFYFRTTFRNLMQNYDTLSRIILYYTFLKMKQLLTSLLTSINRIGNKR